ncbi:MAG: ATP-binding cassette domain-containing protein [Deltaproteobacteria bacterium]|nr:ATP-binding cassette domain-containing protein [Deltaproteobacteria bacterium]
MSTLIELRDVSERGEDGRMVFDGVSLELRGGERVFLTAPPGSGKGLLLRWMAGISMPEKGTVCVFGKDTARLSAGVLNAMRCRMGLLVLNNVLISNLKVIENCALPLLYHTEMPYKEAMEKAGGLLSRSGFTGDPWELPGPLPMYVKKQVAIARALALDPEVVICENMGEGLTEADKEHLFGLLLGWHGGAPSRLLLATSAEAADAALINPGRRLRIAGAGIAEAH